MFFSFSRRLIDTGMYAVLTLNLIVNCVTLISSLLLITGAIKVSHAMAAIDLDSESK